MKKILSTLLFIIATNSYSQSVDPATAMRNTMGSGFLPPTSMPQYSEDQSQPTSSIPQGLPKIQFEDLSVITPPLYSPPPPSVVNKLESLNKVSIDNLSGDINKEKSDPLKSYDKAVSLAKSANEQLIDNQKYLIENDNIFKNRYLKQKKFEEKQEAKYQDFMDRHPNTKKKVDRLNKWLDSQNSKNNESDSSDSNSNILKEDVSEGKDSNGNPTTIRRVYKKAGT